MNKKEIAEIKKQFTPANCAITRICGCYVNGEKEKQSTFKQAFLSLPEEEMFKYFDIFRKGLSGTLGKNLINMDFSLEAELNGGTHEFLLKLRESRLTDDMLLNTFTIKLSNLTIMQSIILSSSFTAPTTFPESLLIMRKCLTLLMKYTIISSAVYALSNFQNRDCLTMLN